MLNTLYEFGRQLSQNADREEFDDIISVPPIDVKDIARNIAFHVVEVIFDLDNGTFRLGERPMPFSAEDKGYSHSPYALRCIKIQGGNNKSVYPTVDPRKSFEAWKKTLFGKEDKNGNQPKLPEFVEAIQKDYVDLADSLLAKAVSFVFPMRKAFEEMYPDLKTISTACGMDESNRIAMLYASVVSTGLGISEPTPIAHLDGFDTFLRRKLQKGGSQSGDSEDSVSVSKLCYVTGEVHEDVGEPNFNNRYSLNKMFVTTTKNYAVGFEDSGFSKNYQVSAEAQIYMERASAHVLKHYKVQIAGIDHCILPQFRAGQDLDLDMMTTRLKKNSDLLFQISSKEASGLIKDLETISNYDMYWLSFLGFESDGNFFKSINQIQDISKTHFEQILKTLGWVDEEMGSIEGVNWHKVMAYGKEQAPVSFNFYTIYGLIPVRKEKEKRNEALILFKAILERRPVFRDKLFDHFSELIQCHRFGRYPGNNITPNPIFDFAVRDAVFQYHAFFLFLKKLKLIDMADTTPTSGTLEEKNAAITSFFERMEYRDEHRALFFLGRVLSNVARAQWEKGHESKPVLGKVNYNGMDAAALKRLQIDLFEKCRQYDILKYNEVNFAKFTDLFNVSSNENWDRRMKPNESLFFLLSGYSFRNPSDTAENSDV
ncbi:MAG: TM1802 family CRISPR-associated protein [Bacteroidetes bacterium]|nr:TM1802 family CRISPR-associated protein [Bacteroidota bacterium]